MKDVRLGNENTAIDPKDGIRNRKVLNAPANEP